MLLKIPVTFVLSTCISVGGCGYPNSSNVNCRIFASFAFKKSAPSSASAADAATFFSMEDVTCIEPLRNIGWLSFGLFSRKRYPPA